jgi:beta-barrel assembly-enhancing protease
MILERGMIMLNHKARLISFALAVVFAVATTIPLMGPVPVAHAQLFGISEQQEIQIGQEVEKQLASKPGFVNDPVQTQYVADLGHRLARVSERPNLPWTYHILKDNTVNALAAPGGFIFVTAGLLPFVRSENEMGFVLGHETTHIAHRHAVDLAQRDMQLQVGALLLSQILFHGNLAAYQLSQVGRAMLDAKYSRAKEFEADHYGVIFAQKAGFDPNASVSFFDRLHQLEAQSPQSVGSIFASHPPTPDRIKAVQAELRQMGYPVAGVATPPLSPSVPAAQPVRHAPVPPYIAPSFSTDNR